MLRRELPRNAPGPLLESTSVETQPEINTMPSLKPPLITLGVVGLLSFVAYHAALEQQAGGMHEFHGRHSSIKRALYALGGMLGPTGCLIAGSLLGAAAAWWLVRTVQARRKAAASTLPIAP